MKEKTENLKDNPKPILYEYFYLKIINTNLKNDSRERLLQLKELTYGHNLLL